MANFARGEETAKMWLGVIPGWLGFMPMIACLLVGVVMTATRRSQSPVSLGVGVHMVPGYLFGVLASIAVFAGAVGPVNASVTLFDTYPLDQ